MNKFIGSGITFPIKLNELGRPNKESNVDLINSSIMTIINWPIAQKFFNEEFGCRAEELLEEPNDELTKTLLSHFITDALTIWERRILINNSGVSILNIGRDKIMVKITYRINKTKKEETFIFPFYKEIIY